MFVKDQEVSKSDSNCSSNKKTDAKESEQIIEILREGQECPFCHFANLKREDDEIICPVCGYGHKPNT
jgi:ribosomal protein L37AE/L43A